jgi:hypothetical protein
MLRPLEDASDETITRVELDGYGHAPRLEETWGTSLALLDVGAEPSPQLGEPASGGDEELALTAQVLVTTRGARGTNTSSGEDPRAHLAAIDRLRAAVVRGEQAVAATADRPGVLVRLYAVGVAPVPNEPDPAARGTGLVKQSLVTLTGVAEAIAPTPAE